MKKSRRRRIKIGDFVRTKHELRFNRYGWVKKVFTFPLAVPTTYSSKEQIVYRICFSPKNVKSNPLLEIDMDRRGFDVVTEEEFNAGIIIES